jgi:hypothetical protein
MDRDMAITILTMRASHHSWDDIHMRFSQSYPSPARVREATRAFGKDKGWDISWAFPQSNGGKGAIQIPSDWKERIKR